MLSGETNESINLGPTWERNVGYLQDQIGRCEIDDLTRFTLQQFAENTLPSTPSSLREPFWNDRRWLDCSTEPAFDRQLALYAALASRDPARIASASADVIAKATIDSERRVVGYAWLSLQLSRIVGINLEGLPLEAEEAARELARSEFPQDSKLIDAIWQGLRANRPSPSAP
jgi:hypothetical protein